MVDDTVSLHARGEGPTGSAARDGSAVEAPVVSAGDCVGRYTIRERIGAGGMGEVFAAYDPVLEREVAVKVLRPSMVTARAAARFRLQREAQALARLNHPNVVSVYDSGTVGDALFVAMELLPGPTLEAWLDERRRGWREVVEVFREAGRGLAVAHAAGIVHRDFKPANVLLGEHVKVVDFGLARTRDDGEVDSAEGSRPGALDCGITLTGQWLGTPAYMAPELRSGVAASPASDQYAFGVALHEALYGARPGEPLAPSAVPTWLRAIVQRALAARPEDRYPSMQALLADLARDRGAARRRWLAAGAFVATAAALALALAPHRATTACPDPAPLVAPVWDDAARARVAAAFLATGSVHAPAMFARVDAALRARLGAWAAGHRDACEATHVRREQSDAMFDLRMQCLAGARQELASLVGLLAHPDERTVASAAQAATEAGSIDECADVTRLMGAAAPPRDPAAAAAVAALREDLGRVDAFRLVGRLKEEVALGRDVLARARQLGDRPLLARALASSGRSETTSGEVDRGIELLYEAARLGSEIKADGTVAEAMIALVYALGSVKQQLDASEVAYRTALAAIAHAGGSPRLLAQLLHFRAYALDRKGQHANALATRLPLLLLYEQTYGPESHQAATNLALIADEMGRLGDARAARAIFDRAIAATERALGPAHPLLQAALSNAAGNHIVLREHDEAAALLERARAISETVYGPNSPAVASALHKLAVVRLQELRLGEAQALLVRAIRIRTTALGAHHPLVASAEADLASALVLAGQPAEAHELLQAALAAQHRAFGDAHPKLAESYREDVRALLALERIAEARLAVERAIAIDRQTIGENHADHGESLRLLADVLRAERRPAEAAPLYRRAAALIASEVGADSPALVGPMVGQCEALVAAGERGEARAAALRAVALSRTANADEQARAEFCLARTEPDRRQAAIHAREARARLAALPYPSPLLPRIDRWLSLAAR